MYIERFRAYHSDCDPRGILKLDIFQQMLLDTACSAAESMGFGIKELNHTHRTWVLARFQMHIIQAPKLYDYIEIETWIEQSKLAFSTRDFRVYRVEESGDRTLIANAKSIWAVIDTTTRENVNFTDIESFPMQECGGAIDLPSMPRPDRKTATIDTTHSIVYSDLDQNGHCNASRYLEMMTNAYGSADGLNPVDFIISYSHEVFFGQTVTISRTDTPNPFFSIYNPDGLLCATAYFIL